MMVFHKTERLLIYLCAISLYTCQDDQGFNQDLMMVLQHMCPYNDFCQVQARQEMEEKAEFPCCRPCSCDKECEHLRSCCPDIEGKGNDLVETKDETDTPSLTCKSVTLGWTKPLMSTINDVSLNRKHPAPHFLITDRCPNNETDSDLKRKCDSIDMSSFDGFVWVSDKATGQIFQNRFCAKCHGVTHYVYWTIGIKECTSALDESLPINYILQNNNCLFILNEPSEIGTVASKYRCFVPDISQCNQTGTWTQFNKTIYAGCETFDMPFITETVGGSIDIVYKNKFCMICNNPPLDRIKELCSEKNFRFEISVSFIGIIDFNRLHEKTYETSCESDEVFDHVLDTCHQIHCQLGWKPRDGTCVRNPIISIIASIEVVYHLKLLQLPTVTAAEDAFFKLVLNQIQTHGITVLEEAFGYEDLGCQPCFQMLYVCPSSQNEGMGSFYLHHEVKVTRECSFDILLNHMVYYLNQSIDVDPDHNITFHVDGLFKGNISDLRRNRNVLGDVAKPFFCGGIQRLVSGKTCPRLILDYSDIASFPSGKTRTQLLAFFKDSNEDSLEICTEDYFDILSRFSVGAMLKKKIMCVYASTLTCALMVFMGLL